MVTSLLALAISACASLPSASVTPAFAFPVGNKSADISIWPGRGLHDGATPGFLLFSGDGDVAATTFEGQPLANAEAVEVSHIDIAALPLTTGFVVVAGGLRRQSRGVALVLVRLADGGRTPAEILSEWPTDLARPSAFCMRQRGDRLHAVAIDRTGEGREYVISASDGVEPRMEERQRFRVARAVGCAVHPIGNAVYVGDRSGGIWRQTLSPPVPTAPVLAAVPWGASTIGPALVTQGMEDFLVSGHGQRGVFSVCRLDRTSCAWVGSFVVRDRRTRRMLTRVVDLDVYGASAGTLNSGQMTLLAAAQHDQRTVRVVAWPDIVSALTR